MSQGQTSHLDLRPNNSLPSIGGWEEGEAESSSKDTAIHELVLIR